MDYLQLTKEKLNIDAITELVKAPQCGAVSLFVGTTRDNFENKKVLRLEYEAYEPMAVKSLKSICEQLREKFDIHHIAIYHRLGVVPVLEASVIIAVSSAHRKSSLEAVGQAIELLKANVPIWKKEIYEGDTEPQWKENAESPNISDTEDFEVPDHLIQIHATASEIKRRIESFIQLKRNQANETNIKQFCMFDTAHSDTLFSCARVDAVYTKRKAADSHVKVHRVRNIVGPQSHGPDPLLAVNSNVIDVNERLSNVEKHLKLSPTKSSDILVRLKDVEDKILFLESLSPEYYQLLNQPSQQLAVPKATLKKIVSDSELNDKVKQLEMKLLGGKP